MKKSLSAWLKTPWGKLTAVCVPMILVWGYLLIGFGGGASGSWLPTDADFEKVRGDIRKNRAELQTLEQKAREEDALKKGYDERVTTYWLEIRDGDVEMLLRDLVDVQARKLGLTLQSLGSVRTTKINNDLFYADLDLTVSDEPGTVAAFLAAVEEIRPKVCWKRIDLRMDFQRPGQQQGNNAVSAADKNKATAAKTTNAVTASAASGDKIRFSGTLRVICSETLNGSGSEAKKP